MTYLQTCEVAQAVQLLQDGSSVHPVARRFAVSPLVISRAWRIFRETGQYSRRTGQRRRRDTHQAIKKSHQEDGYLVLSARRFRRGTAPSLQSDMQHGTGEQMSDQTVRNQLHSSESWSRRPFLSLILTPRHRAARRAFAREHQIWQVCYWRPMLFTDRSQFNLSGSDGRVTVWRSTGERYQAANTIQHNRFGGGSVLVRGGIPHEGRRDQGPVSI